MVTFIY